MPVTPFNYDPTTDAGKVRFLAFDTDWSNAVLNDYEIQAALDLNQGEVKLAGAQCLERMAANKAIVLQKGKLLDIQTDGEAVASALLECAAELRRQVQEDPFAWDWAEDVDEINYPRRILDDYLRHGV